MPTAPHEAASRTDVPRPRVVLLTSPGLFGAEIIDRLAAEAGIDLVGVGLTARLYRNKGLARTAVTFLRRTGWRYFLYNALIANVSWGLLRTSGRPSGLARMRGNIRMLHDVNAEATRAWLRSLSPDFLVSFYFNQWIGPEVRTLPSLGCVNLHPSLLPGLRGPDPVFRALERGLTTTGFTIHEVHDDFDAGRILHQEPFAIPPGLTEFGLYLSLVRTGSDLLARWLGGRVESHAPPEVLAGHSDDYHTFPTGAEVAEFHRRGRRLVQFAEWRRALAAVR